MPAPLYHFFSEGARNIVYGWAREIIVEVGVMLLERGRVFAVGRAASARVAFEQHTGQLWTPLLRGDFPSIKYVLGRAALFAAEAFFFHAAVYLLETMHLTLTGHRDLGMAGI